MARTDKPYRVYRGGRVRGGVPLRTKPARPEAKDGEDRYRGPSKPARERKRWGWGRRIGVGLALFVLLLVVWTLAGYLSFRGGVGAANKRVSPGTKAALDSQDGLLLSHATDILLLGSDHSSSDARAGDRHSDSIMLVRTDPSHHRIIYLSIPRDLRVPIPGHGDSKINAAFQIGGPALAIRTVRHFTGLPINHVVTVDFGSFKQLIDDVGGVDIDVPENILSNRFDCPYATQARCQRWPGWRFHKGEQHMNGQRALIYSRIRENRLNPSESDVTRAERQQRVVQATIHKLSSFGTYLSAPFKAGKYMRPVATDLSAWQLVQLGWVYKRAGAGRAYHCRLGGSASSIGGQSVIVPTQENFAVVHMVKGDSAPQPPPPGSGPYGPGCVIGDRGLG
ncbi:MAG TPA: LCP family protein [Gaiellaceae bacterium]|nr:LCP family protein [Gaiellaceae bacterium]